MVRVCIFGLAGLEAALLLWMFILSETEPRGGGLNGGPEMALFFYVIVPAAFLALAVVVFRFARSRFFRWASALAIVAPLVALVVHEVQETILRYHVREDASGRGYFETRPAKRLAEAVVQGDTAAVAALVGSTDIRQFGESNETFLRLALERTGDKAALVAILLRAGADPNQNGNWPGDGGWPLRSAIYSGDAAVIGLLLDAGADPNRVDNQGQPAFFTALEYPDMLALLLPRGVRLTEENAEGWTALMFGVRTGRWRSVDMMLDAGADPAHVSKSGLTLAGTVDLVKREKIRFEEPVPPELLALEERLRTSRRP